MGSTCAVGAVRRGRLERLAGGSELWSDLRRLARPTGKSGEVKQLPLTSAQKLDRIALRRAARSEQEPSSGIR